MKAAIEQAELRTIAVFQEALRSGAESVLRKLQAGQEVEAGPYRVNAKAPRLVTAMPAAVTPPMKW